MNKDTRKEIKSQFKASDFLVGDLVIYIPNHANENANHPDCERGYVSTIKSGIEDKIWVRFKSACGVAFATAIALIPLKANAWLDLSERARNGEAVKARDIAKHRTDVFRLAATLPGTPGPDLPREILSDLSAFLDSFPEESSEWAAILASLKATLGGNLKPAALRSAIHTYFRLA